MSARDAYITIISDRLKKANAASDDFAYNVVGVSARADEALDVARKLAALLAPGDGLSIWCRSSEDVGHDIRWTWTAPETTRSRTSGRLNARAARLRKERAA